MQVDLERGPGNSSGRNTSPSPALLACCGCICGIGILLMCILIPLHFKYLELDYYGLLKQTYTRRVLYDRGVFEAGRYDVGIPYEFVKYPATLMDFDLNNENSIAVFVDNGVEINIDVSFQCYFPKTSIIDVHRRFRTSYEGRILVVSIEALKNIAPDYTYQNYTENRGQIALDMYEALRDKLLEQLLVVVPPGKFQMRRITVPERIQDQNLQVFTQSQENIKRGHELTATLVRKETETLQQAYFANITIVEAKAEANYQNVTKAASSQIDATLQTTLGSQLTDAFSRLNISTQENQKDFLKYVSIIYSEINNPAMLDAVSANIILNS